MAKLYNLARMTTSTTGTGAITLGVPVAGYLTFAQAGVANGDVVAYGIKDGNNSEIGTGTYSPGGPTLTRTVSRSTNANAALNLSGTAEVFITARAEDILSFDAAMSLTSAQQAQGRSNICAAPFDALASKGLQTNGGCEVSQQYGQNPVAAVNSYLLDGWLVNTSGFVVSGQQVSDAPPGYNNSLKISVTTAVPSIGSSEFIVISHYIEGYDSVQLAFGSGNAQPISFGFWVKAHRPGTYSGGVRNGSFNRSYSFTFTINAADTWEFKTVTVFGDTSGTWFGDNRIGLAVTFVPACFSGSLTTPGAWMNGNFVGATGSINGGAATTDTFQITGLIILPGLELPMVGSSPSIMRPFDQELFRSQRFYSKGFPVGTPPFNGGGASRISALAWATTAITSQMIRFPRNMRVSPTMTFFCPAFQGGTNDTPVNGFWQWLPNGSAWRNTAVITAQDVYEDSFNVNMGVSGATVGGASLVLGNWTANARL